MKPAIFILAIVVFASSVDRVCAEEERRLETEHLIIEWSEGTETNAIENTETEGERFYSAIRSMLGYEPESKITILLRGPAEQSDGRRGYPHVDSWGRIHLYQFGPDAHSYISALAHEMVHVFRFELRADADWFFEEGFAEFVALRVDPSLQGFPWYGFPIVVAAGQWVAKGEDVSLTVLRERHNSLNQPCKAQSYSLRSSFFQHLGETYGEDPVLQMAHQELAGELSDYSRFLGQDFSTLEAEWREALLTEYSNTADVDELSRRYREESPIQYMTVCRKGEQF